MLSVREVTRLSLGSLMVAYLAISCLIRSDCTPDRPNSFDSAFWRAISPSLPVAPVGVSVPLGFRRSSSSSLAFTCCRGEGGGMPDLNIPSGGKLLKVLNSELEKLRRPPG